jgi:hypothetical protein
MPGIGKNPPQSPWPFQVGLHQGISGADIVFYRLTKTEKDGIVLKIVYYFSKDFLNDERDTQYILHGCPCSYYGKSIIQRINEVRNKADLEPKY